MKTERRIAALCMAALCIVPGFACTMPEQSLTALAAEVTGSGTCGENAVWQLDSDGTLTVSGTGAMYDLNSRYAIPWEAEKDSIRTVVIGKGITAVGGQAFSNCKNLASVSLSDTVTSIGESAFNGCSALASVGIPASVTHIGTFAFALCKKLTAITIPASVSSIGSLAFSGTPWLNAESKKTPYVIINGLLIYGPDTEEAVIPAGVTDIVSNAFWGRSRMKKVIIPDTVKIIEYNAFSNCSGLVGVTVPDSVEEIGMQAFTGCTALAEVTVLNPACSIFDRATTFSNDSKTYSGVLKGYDGSAAEAYAGKYGYRFESLGPVPLRGDFNGDGSVGIEDAQGILSAYAKTLAGGSAPLTDMQRKTCDINGDGAVDVADAQLVLNYYVKNTVAGNPTDWETLLKR